MVKKIAIGYLLLIPALAFAQTPLTLQQAYDLAQANYPVIRQKDLLAKTSTLAVSNLGKAYLPQVSLSAQASYQSDVTRIPVSLPGLSIDPPSKDQYKVLADVSEVLYDGGITREQQQQQRLATAVEQQKLDVELYQVKTRINQLFLGILYADAQLKQVELVKADLQTGIHRVEAQVNNGVAFRSNLAMLQAELLKAEQRAIEWNGARTGLINSLAEFTGKPLDAATVFELPTQDSTESDSIRRPELQLYAKQTASLQQQDRLITARNKPKASVFVQGGYGRPGLNLLKNDFDFYYIGGIRINWSLGNLYTAKKERESIALNRQIIATQQENFLLTTNTQLAQLRADIDKYRLLCASDGSIIQLRKTVTDAAKAQLENGVITATDFLRQVNEEDQARQQLIIHTIQLLQSRINYRTLTGQQ